MTVSNASAGYRNYQVNHRSSRRRWVSACVAVATCVAMIGQSGRSEDADDEEISGPSVTNSIGMKLAWIPAGEFMMGSGDEPRVGNETEHRVRITKPFHMGVHEVTQGEWEAIMETTPWTNRNGVKQGDRYPAVGVSWEDASDFCRILTVRERKSGRLKATESYRLPTEAEWEYACRAGSTTRYHFGDKDVPLGEYAWYFANAKDVGEEYAHEVGRKRANAWGLFDMHGNVWEWCSDRFEYYRHTPATDPQGPSWTWSRFRVMRGGSWDRRSYCCRSTYRLQAWGPGGTFGFRVVRSSNPSEIP